MGNRLYRYELSGNKLVNPKILLDLPVSPHGAHNGGKIIIGPDNSLYLVVGDMERNDNEAQNYNNGKTPDDLLEYCVLSRMVNYQRLFLEKKTI